MIKMIAQIGKQLGCLKDFLLPQSFNYFKGGHDGYIQNQRKPVKQKKSTSL